MHNRRKILLIIPVLALLACMFCCTVVFAEEGATGDVSGVIQDTWGAAAGQIKAVVNTVVFPAIDLILAVFFFGKIATAYMDYRKHGQFEWTAPAILFAGLVFSLTAPLYLWNIIGI